ncbi:aminoglycoside phosphotransferase family protein [Micromonospora sp. DR5-3]|uniref:phosphotransferase family protein n=1 Tax=unclassified Micromonospora TaxID=2617518 RepID=UPI0016527D5B|nr:MULTISPECIES: aminoglycoside phosphotransferase family protein [unclassified Micromonospora]MCW3819340.1 aminoglycoside phosphotransferase family protein [Micromonospora sp. DR5-3]
MVLRAFGVTTDQESNARLESRSGAGVCAVRTSDGRAAYLKVTPATLGPQAIAAARRELRFYTEIAPVAPVRAPRLLDCLDAGDGVAVLLAAAGETRRVPEWTTGTWAALGRDLAGLHDMPIPTGTDWQRPDALQEALTDPNLAEIDSFWASALPQLGELLARRAELMEQLRALPPAFVHGDCHTANLVHSAGAIVFCDWQAAGIGRPASDLAFLSVRATPNGAIVPPALLDAYLDARACDRRALRRALLAEELAVFVFLWPAFAALNSPQGIARVRRRTLRLSRRWFSTAG